jgi:hypothetical protein
MPRQIHELKHGDYKQTMPGFTILIGQETQKENRCT